MPKKIVTQHSEYWLPFKNLKLKGKSEFWSIFWGDSQSEFTCSKLAIETLEEGVKYVQS